MTPHTHTHTYTHTNTHTHTHTHTHTCHTTHLRQDLCLRNIKGEAAEDEGGD